MAAEGPGPAAPRRPLLAPEPVSPAQVVAGVLGIVLVIAGLVGLAVDSSFHTGSGVQGKELLGLEVNGWHNLVHIAFGLVGLAFASSAATARLYLIGGGVVYLLLWFYGLLIDQAGGANFVPFNTADNWLHFALGTGMIVLGFATTRGRELAPAT